MKKEILLIGYATERMLERIAPHFNVHNLDTLDATKKDKIEAIITNGHDGVPEDLMDTLPSLAIISCYGVGYDAINVEKAKNNRVMVTHTPKVLNDDVANTAIMLLLATSRRMVEYDKYVREGHWPVKGNTPLTDSIQNKSVGFLGMGRIGQNIAKKCEMFSMEISYYSRHKKTDLPYKYCTSLETMAKDVTYLIVIAPGGDSTKHLVDADILKALGADGTLINVGRGSIVDEDALISALKNNIIKSAGLDVFANEPHVPKALLELDNVVLQPHVASATIETRQAMGDLTIDNVIDYFQKGKAITPVVEMEG